MINRKYAGKVDPVKKALIVTFILFGLSTYSYFTKNSFSFIKGRSLLSAEGDYESTTDTGLEEETTVEPQEEYSDEVTDNVSSLSSDCIKPEITHFPDPLINKESRQRGAIIIHIALAIYMFIGLTIVCNDYFVPSLTRVSDALCLSSDVAGATLMAAGSSAPELATSVIAVFVSKGEVSTSSVIGSAVFNITLVIAVCSLLAPRPLQLRWYPVIRDSGAYLVCIVMFLCIMANNVVSLPEALLFVAMYAVYCVGMKYNDKVEAWVTAKLPVPQSWSDAGDNHEDDKDPEKADSDSVTEKLKENGAVANGGNHATENGKCNGHTNHKTIEKDEGDEIKDPLKKPVMLDDGKMAVVSWYITLPLRYMTVYTIPDCRHKQWSSYFLLSFAMSVFWICLYSYILVWMMTIIGFTFSIPDTIMSLTFVAAAVSVQDALSGIAVVKEGYGDMAVSNAIGSNVFDFLICLGIPWLLQTLFINPGQDVIIVHKGVVYSGFILISTVVFLLGVCHFNNWKMDQKFGTILLVWYLVLITFASLYETNTFGNFNLEECGGDY